jgi:hypothetical protein
MITIKAFENVAGFEHLETTVTIENCIHEGIKSKLNVGNTCCHGVQNILSSCLLTKNLKIKPYKTECLPLVLYACVTWSFTLREAHRLREFEKRVLRRVCGPEREEVTGSWRRLHNEKLYKLYCPPNIIRAIK